MFTAIFTSIVLVTFTAATVAGPCTGAATLQRVGAYLLQGAWG